MTTVTTLVLRDYLQAQLAAASGLADVKVWRNAQPVVYPASPFGWVRPEGGSCEPRVSAGRKITDSFEIVVVVKHPDPDTAENKALGYKEAVEALVDADPTLNSQVSCAWVSARESMQFNEGKSCFSAWKVTVTSIRLK